MYLSHYIYPRKTYFLFTFAKKKPPKTPPPPQKKPRNDDNTKTFIVLNYLFCPYSVVIRFI